MLFISESLGLTVEAIDFSGDFFHGTVEKSFNYTYREGQEYEFSVEDFQPSGLHCLLSKEEKLLKLIGHCRILKNLAKNGTYEQILERIDFISLHLLETEEGIHI